MRALKGSIKIAVVLTACLILAGCQNHFKAEDIHDIAKLAVGQEPEQGIQTIMQALETKYPGKIRHELQWHFNWTGGTLGQMAIVYASLNEYILIFGSPIGSEGFSGRYSSMDVYDCMFAGEMTTYMEGQIERTVYLPGDMAVLERHKGKGYTMTPGTYMLEYTTGNTLFSLPTGLFAPFNVTNDLKTVWDVFWDYGGLVMSSWFMWF